ncbi:MAG: hypothetical protein ACYC6G_14030 [Desulfobaccales bacterium]
MSPTILCKERKSCPSGKVGYFSQVAALFDVVTIERAVHRKGRYPRRAYFCTRCRRWHLTSMTRED